MLASTLILLGTAGLLFAAAGVVAWRSQRLERHIRERSS